MNIRLDKIVADTGKYSRREARELIRDGRLTVDGVTRESPEFKCDPDRAQIAVDGAPLSWSNFHYYMLDKPAGVLTATADRSQNTVIDLLPPEIRRQGLFPVGRLDKDTTGLLILTNDGDFAHRVISPKSEIRKLYLAETDGTPTADDVRAFAEGLTLGDGTRCLPAKLEPLGECRCLVTVFEGKYHQVKRMLASRGKPVKSLRRLTIGTLQIDEDLGAGGFRKLTEDEKNALFARIDG
jgi:16S rRNA pseudouridine516 synthase